MEKLRVLYLFYRGVWKGSRINIIPIVEYGKAPGKVSCYSIIPITSWSMEGSIINIISNCGVWKGSGISHRGVCKLREAKELLESSGGRNIIIIRSLLAIMLLVVYAPCRRFVIN
jgi:hypothetical protein